MPRMLISLAVLAALTRGAYAQSPAPAAAPAAPAASTPATQPPPTAAKGDDGASQTKPAGTDTAAQDKPADKSGTGDTANQETYKMKDGGMYQPPAQRPASPAQDLDIYGRT